MNIAQIAAVLKGALGFVTSTNGNLAGNVIHRTGTAASLLTLDPATNTGEIAVATDEPSLVVVFPTADGGTQKISVPQVANGAYTWVFAGTNAFSLGFVPKEIELHIGSSSVGGLIFVHAILVDGAYVIAGTNQSAYAELVNGVVDVSMQSFGNVLGNLAITESTGTLGSECTVFAPTATGFTMTWAAYLALEFLTTDVFFIARA